jgi:Flp pilus assembly pilin Flp
MEQQSTAHRKRGGQVVIEYATLIGIVVAALVAMLIYVKRGVSGRLRSAADSLGESYSPRHTTTTAPIALNTVSQSRTDVALRRDVEIGDLDEDGTPEVADVVMTTTEMIPDAVTGLGDSTTRRGSETVAPLKDEKLWDWQ